MSPGESYQLGRYKFTFDGVKRVAEANYQANEGTFTITNSEDNTGARAIELKPQKRFYSSGNAMTEASIDSTIGRDLFISLGEDLGNGTWSVRLYLKSFIVCIWLGGFIMALGGLFATMDRRYRRPRKKTQTSPAVGTNSQVSHA